MSEWVTIIERHRAKHGLGPWDIIPESHYELIAKDCSTAAIAEVRERLDKLDKLDAERESLPADDGDAHDDVWRARGLFEAVLAFRPPSAGGP